MPIDIVCQGWDRLADGADFYPDDLPADWRLSYFANALGAVYLPAEDWTARPEQTLTDWGGDVPAGFRFYLELPPPPAAARAASRAQRALGDRLAGLVDPAPPTTAHAQTPRWHRVADMAALADAGGAPHGRGLALQLCAAPDEHPRSVRGRLETLRQDCGAVPLLLLLEPPAVGTVLRWRTIAELLGWP